MFPSGMPRAIVSLCALEAAAASSISSFCLPLVHCSSSPAANHHTFPISQILFFLQTHRLNSLTWVFPMHNPPGRPAAPCTEDKRPAEPTEKWGASPPAGSTFLPVELWKRTSCVRGACPPFLGGLRRSLAFRTGCCRAARRVVHRTYSRWAI